MKSEVTHPGTGPDSDHDPHRVPAPTPCPTLNNRALEPSQSNAGSAP